METKAKNYSLSDLAKQGSVNTTHTLRLQAEGVGIGLMTFASYTAKTFAGSLITESAKALDKGIKWNSEDRAILCAGRWGSVVRIGKVSVCGKYALRNGVAIALDVSDGDFIAKNAGSVASLIAHIASGELNAKDFSFSSKTGSFSASGIGFSTRENWSITKGAYASLAFISGNGKIVFHDMESGKNCYNSGTDVLGGGVSDDKAKEARDRLLITAGSGSAKAVSAKTKAKAKGAKAKGAKK